MNQGLSKSIFPTKGREPLGRMKPSRDGQRWERISTLNFPFFLWGLPTPVYFLAFCASKSSFSDEAKFEFCFCHLKSKASWWYSWYFILLFRWHFPRRSKDCHSRTRQTRVPISTLLLRAVLTLDKVLQLPLSPLWDYSQPLPQRFTVRIRRNNWGSKIILWHLVRYHST